jgi:ABC-type phosphonate transport system ATPase subunit
VFNTDTECPELVSEWPSEYTSNALPFIAAGGADIMHQITGNALVTNRVMDSSHTYGGNAVGADGIETWDVSEPATPVKAGTFDTAGSARAVASSGDRWLVADREGGLLVLADEPTGNLDTHSADEVFALMRQFNRDEGTTFLIVTHDPIRAKRCDRILHLERGILKPFTGL